MKRRAVLIAGPTASGKSALALATAERLGGVIVNADSMQIYDVLRVLTARPSDEDMARAPHLLYGVVPPAERFSTGAWYAAVRAILDDDAYEERPLIFVGGTGLYFDALLHGVATVPEVPREFVAQAEAELQGLDRAGRGALLAARDPEMAVRLGEPDRQRVARALSVLAATGKSLAHWQARGQAGLLQDFDMERLVVDPDRDVLRERIARRFSAMMAGPAIQEVETLLALGLDPSLPAMKAIGVREIAALLKGEISREQAEARAITATRQYAKRQRTWLRNRMGDWPRVRPER